ncbi:hypothetical protein QP999_09520 [Corynebacterium sp. MSK004]|uniref:hypothetical protein n=1 Tax=Corynebacterium sp. MSK004 TaxID=3050186 RepID=UPI00254A471E|nr:hypothetical protein [Corynebacterium sp. MSK004]MDK8898173.1 hypothetical protein [Corynebacterium sp. MSK004]
MSISHRLIELAHLVSPNVTQLVLAERWDDVLARVGPVITQVVRGEGFGCCSFEPPGDVGFDGDFFGRGASFFELDE